MQTKENPMVAIEDKYVCKSVVLAKYIVSYANKHNFSINITKVQKLLYIVYGVYLAVTGKRLTNEHPQAWPYGPVFPSTRNALIKIDLDNYCEVNETIPNDVKSCVKIVFDSYGGQTAGTLTEWSHQAGSPWEKTMKQKGFVWGNTIPDVFIKDYFDSIIIRNG